MILAGAVRVGKEGFLRVHRSVAGDTISIKNHAILPTLSPIQGSFRFNGTHRLGSVSTVPRIDPMGHRIPMSLSGNGEVGGGIALVASRIWQEPAQV